MSGEMIFWVATAIVTLLSVVLLRIYVYHRLPPFTRHVLIALAGIILVLAVLHAYADIQGGKEGRLWLLNANQDWSIPTIASAAELLLVAVAAWAVGFLVHGVWSSFWQRLYWVGFGMLFLYIAVDDYFTIHEYLDNTIFLIIAMACGLVVVAATLLIFRQKLRTESSLFIWLVVGLIITVVMGTIFERYVIWIFICHGPFPALGSICDSFHFYEEFGEFVGVTIILITLIAWLERHVTAPQLNRVKRVGAGVALIGIAGMVGNMWLFPSLEARYWATPANVTYQDGDLSLVGYRLAPGLHQPGDTVPVTLYWRANRKIANNIRLSLHLVTPDDFASVYQVDLLGVGRYPTSAWFAGTVERRVVRLKLPPDLETPAGYLLTVTPRRRGGEVELEDSDRRVLLSPTVALDYLPLTDTRPLPAPPRPAAIDFATLFTLTGYDLPSEIAAGDDLSLRFWWDVKADVAEDYVQFIHVADSAGNTVAALDAEPLAGKFPTQSWQTGMRFIEPVAVDLPDDLPPGEYQVMMGMYTLPDVIRLPVTSAGEPLQDNLIPLGSVRVVGP